MAQNTPFSFHCMICFEEFHPEDRYPVVLPCGHTYVCNCCADRLDKCMECRTPLFTTVPGPKPPALLPQQQQQGGRNWSSSSRAAGHGRAGPNDAPPPPPVIKKRFPLPKNVVLLSLIEATELAAEDVRNKSDSSPEVIMETSGTRRSQIDFSPSMGSLFDTAEDEEEKIKVGTSLTVGMAGTYAVAARQGLDIYAERPNNTDEMDQDMSGHSTSEDVDTLVRFFHLDQKLDPQSPTPGNGKDARLSFGDRVQVVSVEGEWAKLSRGYGFVRADKNQLVKVGGPVDRACSLEAMLRTLSLRRKELRYEQSKIDNQFIRFMNELQASLRNDEDLTVIVADTFASSATNFANVDDEDTSTENDENNEGKLEVADRNPRSEERNDRAVVTYPMKLERQSTPPSQPLRFVCFAGDVFQSSDMEQRLLTDRPPLESSASAGSPRHGLNSHVDSTTLFPSASHPSPSAMKAGAQAWRERHGRSPSTGIDFRTGLSGHMALLSTHAHAHEYLNAGTPTHQPVSGMKFPKMSSHTGLSFPKVSRSTIWNSLTLPILRTPPRAQGDAESVPQSGSM